jgi:hypothetical protein
MRSRGLTKSNESFQNAVRKWLVALASTFRYCGGDQKVCVKYGKGSPRFDINDNSYAQSKFENPLKIFAYVDRRFSSLSSPAPVPVCGFDAASS